MNYQDEWGYAVTNNAGEYANDIESTYAAALLDRDCRINETLSLMFNDMYMMSWANGEQASVMGASLDNLTETEKLMMFEIMNQMILDGSDAQMRGQLDSIKDWPGLWLKEAGRKFSLMQERGSLYGIFQTLLTEKDVTQEFYNSALLRQEYSNLDEFMYNRGKIQGIKGTDASVNVAAFWMSAKGSVSNTADDVINQGATARLKNGYYEVNGVKFSEYYYNRLWTSGRGGPSLVANEILDSGVKGVPGKVEGFYNYQYGGWEMVYNPASKEVWHLQPISK